MRSVLAIAGILIISLSAFGELAGKTHYSFDPKQVTSTDKEILEEAVNEISHSRQTSLMFECRQYIEEWRITPPQYAKNLSQEDLVFLMAYTRHGFKYLNPPLRRLGSRVGKSQSLIELSQLTNSEFRELEDIDAWVEITTSALNRIEGHECNATRVTTLPEDVFKEIERSGYYREFGFLSSSEGVLEKVGGKYKKFIGEHKFVIKSKNCKNISWISRWEDENEVLFPPGSLFKVRKIDKSTWPTVIYMDHVN